jgi:hypothetical protein
MRKVTAVTAVIPKPILITLFLPVEALEELAAEKTAVAVVVARLRL